MRYTPASLAAIALPFVHGNPVADYGSYGPPVTQIPDGQVQVPPDYGYPPPPPPPSYGCGEDWYGCEYLPPPQGGYSGYGGYPSKPVSQISDGQIQAPPVVERGVPYGYEPVSQIPDGQVQVPPGGGSYYPPPPPTSYYTPPYSYESTECSTYAPPPTSYVYTSPSTTCSESYEYTTPTTSCEETETYSYTEVYPTTSCEETSYTYPTTSCEETETYTNPTTSCEETSYTYPTTTCEETSYETKTYEEIETYIWTESYPTTSCEETETYTYPSTTCTENESYYTPPPTSYYTPPPTSYAAPPTSYTAPPYSAPSNYSYPTVSPPKSYTAPPPPASSCPLELGNSYVAPRLINPVMDSYSNIGKSSYFGIVHPRINSYYTFDVPSSLAESGKICSLYFSLPRLDQLETSSYNTTGEGDLTAVKLTRAVKEYESVDNLPGVDRDYGSWPITQGDVWNLSNRPCEEWAGSSTVKMGVKGLCGLQYFQDYNPCPIGLYIVAH